MVVPLPLQPKLQVQVQAQARRWWRPSWVRPPSFPQQLAPAARTQLPLQRSSAAGEQLLLLAPRTAAALKLALGLYPWCSGRRLGERVLRLSRLMRQRRWLSLSQNLSLLQLLCQLLQPHHCVPSRRSARLLPQQNLQSWKLLQRRPHQERVQLHQPRSQPPSQPPSRQRVRMRMRKAAQRHLLAVVLALAVQRALVARRRRRHEDARPCHQ